MGTSGLLPTPNTMDCLPPRDNEKLRRWNNERDGRKNRKALSNLREAVQDPFYLQAASPASPSPTLDEEKERQTTATSGQRCLPLLNARFPDGSSLKTCVASLLGAKVWFSKNVALTWKASVTKSNRLLFQLAPSARPTEGTECGLLPTATTRDFRSPDKEGSGNFQRKVERGFTIDLNSRIAMLPTPDKSMGERGTAKELTATRPSGAVRQISLNDAVKHGPKTGLRLQPDFAGWMMDYPKGYLDLADGEMPRSKRTGTPSSPK